MPKSRATKSRKKGKPSSSAPSRQPPASDQDASSVPLPAPPTTRTLRPRAHVTRSRASFRQCSPLSATNSRSRSILSSTMSDSDRPEQKRRRLDVREEENEASPSWHPNVVSRPDRTTFEDDDDYMDLVDDTNTGKAEMKTTLESHPDQGKIQTGSPAQIVSEYEAGPSTHHTSPTSPPLTALSPIHGISPDTPSATVLFGSSGGSGSGSRAHYPHETLASPVSSPSLMKIINQTNISPGTVPAKRKHESPFPDTDIIEISNPPTKDKGKGKAKAVSLSPTPPPTQKGPTDPDLEPLSEYTCPICFFPPSNATITPCGHVCCGSCLFTAVKTTLQRSANMGMSVGTGENVARCPVCRAIIPGWDGKGGGVIGLKIRQVISV